jgi:diguanylate cyclase (GGDEF)-like protein
MGAETGERAITTVERSGQTQRPDLTLPRVADILHAAARVASTVPVLVGVFVLVGWAADVEALHRILPKLTDMNPATAVGFICLGLALAMQSSRAPFAVRIIAASLALVAVVLGFSRVLALIGLWDFELDRLLFRAKLALAELGRPNRMAPNTALNFILLGTALITVDRPFGRFRSPAPFLALIAAMTSLLATIGYAYGLRPLYRIGSSIAIALPTAVTFLVLAIGILCARPTHGIMAVVSSNSSGGTMIRRLLPAVLVIPVAMGTLHLAGERARIFDTAVGLWLLAVLIMTVLAILVSWNASLLFRGDIERANTAETLAHLASHDALTRLPNRRLFIERLTSELQEARKNGSPAAVLFIDLDLFKVINDSLGHVVGDEVLIAAGRRIEQCIGSDDTLGRMSGDEFTVLVAHHSARERAVELAQRIKQAFDQPFTIGLHEVFTSVSIGIAFSGDETGEPRDLIRQADIAMYRAKARGKSRFEVFEPAMDFAAQHRLRLENGLRRALANGELRVYYQPEIEIESGRLVGMEALVRWEHPERGLISPAEFIAVAEETGLIVPIGRWVLFEACRQAKEWQTKYRRDRELMVSVNLSGKHLQQATLIDDVREVLEATRIDPSHVVLEITETVAMAGAETTIEILSRLKALGVLLAIDDFGTGFSSLAYLKRFPVDLLKIDKSFVDGVADRGHDTRIVEAIISLGHALGLRVIAEGVETTDQLLQLRSLGSEFGQGYYFGRPLSDDVEHGMPPLLQEHRRWIAEAPNPQRVN